MSASETLPMIFISHSSHDRAVAQQIADRLTADAFAVWLDVESIPDGSSWATEMDRAVRACAAMIVVAGKHAYESEWVENEVLLALELRKPVFVARIDDEPLKIYLIRLQFSDFRGDHDAAYKKLLRALRKALKLTTSAPQIKVNVSPADPGRHNYFDYLAQLPDGETNARIARDLFAWASAGADSITFSGRQEPVLHANVWIGVGGVILFSVRAYRRQPAVEIPLQYLRDFPPLDDPAERARVLEALAALGGVSFTPDRADKRPSIPLTTLASPQAYAAFITLVESLRDRLRA